MDQLALVDAADVRRRYGLAPDRPSWCSCRSRWRCPRSGARRVGSASPVWCAPPARRWPDIPSGSRHPASPRLPALVESVRRFCHRTGRPWGQIEGEERRSGVPARPGRSVALRRGRLSLHLDGAAGGREPLHPLSEWRGPRVRVRRRAVSQRDRPQSHLAGYATYDELFSARPGTTQNFPGWCGRCPRRTSPPVSSTRTSAASGSTPSPAGATSRRSWALTTRPAA